MLTDLDNECVEGKGVVPEHDTADVSDNLGDATHEHTAHKAPGLPSPAQICVCNTENTEEGREDDVGRETRSVLVDAPLDRAVVEVAERVGPEGFRPVPVRQHAGGGIGDGDHGGSHLDGFEGECSSGGV